MKGGMEQADRAVGQVFVVGMNGSGTTMLLDHLASHPEIYGFPAETKCLPYYLQHEREYGDLSADANFARLWADMRKALIGQYRALEVDPALPALARRSPEAVFDHVLAVLACAQGKTIWCEKTPMHVRHIALLSQRFPRARFIHIIRDGRDCAASFHRRWGFNPMRTVTRWKQAVGMGIVQGRALGDRYTEVNYETLTGEPEAAMRRLLAFVGVPFDPAVLAAARARPNETAPRHGQVVRNARSSRDYFSPRQLARMENVAGRLLRDLGYPTGAAGDSDPSRLLVRLWELGDDARRLVTVSLRHGRLFRPSKWRYLAGQIRNALKQKKTA